MADLDASVLANLMLKIGLVNEAQMQEAFEELGQRNPPPEELLRFLERQGAITRFHTQKLIKGDAHGIILGGYKILYKIASGSFGRVYRAEDTQTGRVVAVKVLRQRWSEDEHTIDLFNREGRLGLALRHPNIVEVLAVNQDPITKQYYIVMEFIEGGNLRDFLAIRGKLKPVEALQFIEECASGIAHAYSQGVTHRDLKLTNVLISTHGTAKLVDFGLAGIFTRKGLEIESGEKIDRTVDYAGLEKRTSVKPGDVRSDIYFLGCILYEMLTGRSPLQMTRDPRVRMSPQRFDGVQPMRPEEVQAPPSLYQLVERMMSLEPRFRYQTPSQLLDAIRGVRAEIEGRAAAAADKPVRPSARSVFVVEKNPKAQDALRVRLKELGYRVFIAADPARALDRYGLQPYDALILDAGTTGEEGRYTFEQILRDASRLGRSFAGILILSEDQAEWAREIPTSSEVAIMRPPVSLRKVCHKLQELVPPIRARDKAS
jgi:eukaryotic-like serine/threonine-protein kinase